MKRILLLFSALLLSIIASWAHDVEIDGIYYNLDKTNKTAEVTSKNYWYYNYVYKGSVSIPENITYNSIVYCVTSIGEHAFWNCSGLTSITIPNSVTSIGESAFMWCSGLTSITIPNSVTSIGNGVFSACSGLTSITIPNSVTSIGNSVFSGCSGLTSITIPNSVTSIGENAFYYCSDLTLVTIGNSVTSIGENAFLGCRGLTEIIVSPNNKHFVSEDGVLFNKEKTILIKYPEEKKDTSYVIPNSVTSIGESAFDGCSGLTSITIPNGVTSIGEYAFSGCSGLTKVNYLGSIDEWVDIDLKNITSNPMGHKKKFYINDELLTDVKITSADSINAYAFYNCKSIKSVEIGNSVTSIGSSAFYNCSGLTSVTIHNSVTSIGSSAFYDCSGLTSVTIPNSVTFIGYNAFSGCSGLTSVVWNAEKCSDFYFDYYNDNLVPPFYHVAPQITSFTLGKDVKHIPADLCAGMSNIKDIDIPSNVTSIGSSAFYDCSGLTSVTIPNSVTFIDYNAFSGCSGLTSVVWNAKNFPEPKDYGPFYYSISPQITSFIFGVDVEHIPTFLCHGMTELKEIFIPKNISSIGKEAFSECTNLKKITMYPNTVPNTQGTETFANYNAYLYVPCDVYEDYDLDDVFGNFKYIKCIAAEEVDAPDKVEIEIDEYNNASVIWPSTDGAKKYELEISKDGEVFCTLVFNENGQLTSIDFGNRSASVGFQFTVIGLDAASKYSYSIVAKDERGNELESYNGTFTTNGYSEVTAILETLADANITVSGGTISADTDFTIYNTIGKDVTAQNGSLTPGVYVVKVGDDIAKVMVK